MSEDRRQLELQAYHDGELRGLRRFLVARRVARDPEARRELEELGALGTVLRDAQAGDAGAGPDLWEAIRAELPTAPSPLRDTLPKAEPRVVPSWRRPARMGGLGGAVGAGLVAVLLALLWVGGDPGDAATGGSVRWLDAGTTPTMVLQDDREATIIWLLEPGDATGMQAPRRRTDALG